LRIALIAHFFGLGDGQGRVNYEIAHAALNAGFEVTLVAENCADDIARQPGARFIRIPVSRMPSRFLKNFSFAIRSARWLGRNRTNFDVIQANGFVTFASADIVAAHFVHGAWLKSPYAAIGSWSFAALYQRAYTWLNSLLEQTAFRRADKIVAVSENVADELKFVGVADRRIVVIFNGVDVKEFLPRKPERSLFGLPSDVTLFLFSGDIRTRRKNLDGILRAVAQIEDVHLAVAGRIDESPFPALAEQLGIAHRVHFLGYVSAMNALMCAADVFIFPSRYDPMGLVVPEAMASGLPVITAKTTGAYAVLDDPAWTLDDPENLTELVRMARTLAEDPGLRKRVGERNRLKALEHSWQAMASSYLDLYRTVLAEKNARRQVS